MKVPFFPNPKTARKRKPKTRRIAPRSRFFAWDEIARKGAKRKRTDAQVMTMGMQRKQQRLGDRTAAEMAFARLLDSLGVLYESEAVFLNGDRPQLADFYVKSAKVVFEVDGGYHDDPKQRRHDAGRDAWLLRAYGVRTIRIANRDVFGDSEGIRKLVATTLNLR